MNTKNNNDYDTIYNFDKKDMILRDFLAADRTLLANERTLLSYIRTGISLIAIAISLIKLFEGTLTNFIAGGFIILGIIPIILGIYKHRKINRKLENIIYRKNIKYEEDVNNKEFVNYERG